LPHLVSLARVRHLPATEATLIHSKGVPAIVNLDIEALYDSVGLACSLYCAALCVT